MRKLKLFMTALALVGGVDFALAQTDVTSTYLTNADFEGEYSSYSQPNSDRDIYKPTVWTVSYSNGDTNDLTSLNSECTQWNNFSGKPQLSTGGNNTYWMRFRWGSSENVTLSQETSANLPAGTYCVSVDAYSDDNTGTVTVSAASVTQTIRNNGAWANYKVVFTLVSAQKVTVSLSYTNTAADDHAAAFDNVKILKIEEPTGITLKNVLDGTAANLSDFNVWYDDYTLEVEGTDGTEINVTADNISYTPEATGTVRFVKKDGIVYVFEGTSYKTAVHSSKADYTYTRTLSKDDPITDNYLENPSFETTGDNISGKKYKIGTPWTTNYSGSDIRIDKGTKSGIHGECVLVWRGSGSGKDWFFSQKVTTLPKYKGVKVFLQQIDGGNANAKYNVGVGSAAGDYSYAGTQFTLGSGKNGTYNYELGYNENMATGDVFFSFRNTSNNTSSSGSDPVSQIDWIGLVGSDDFPISGVSSASYVYGTAYAPATAKSSYLAAKAEAAATIADATYTNVTGDERDNLQEAIDAVVADNDAAYNAATDNIQNAMAAFTDALSHYQALIDAQANVPNLAYASNDKKAFITAVATSAADADAKVEAMTNNIRVLYESHAMAEGVDGAVNITSLLENPNNPSNIDGWTVSNTIGNSNMRIMSNESYTDADGTNDHSYFDSNSWNSAFSTTFTQDVELPAGTYILTAKARGNNTTTYQVIADEESTNIITEGNTGGVFGRGWNDYTVEFTLEAKKTVTLGINMVTGSSSNWLSFGDFRLVRIAFEVAAATEYNNLNSAIEEAEGKTLGFEDGEFAPYNNIDALTTLANAKAVNQSEENAKSDIEALTTDLTSAEWTANVGDVDAIYNGDMSEANGNNPKGWTRSNNAWGQQITGLTAEANGVNVGTTTAWYYNTNGAWQYGNDGVYTMPLAANQAYVLFFKYRKNGNDWQNSMTASVVNESNEGLKVAQFPGADNGTTFQSAKAYFTTGAAGNYTLSITQDGNAHLTDVSLVKAPSAEYALSEEATDAPTEMAYYEKVNLTRTLSASYWNTFSVPFDMAIPSGWTVKEFKDVDGNTLNFKDATTIEAGVPYLVKPNADAVNPTFDGVIVKATEGETKGEGDYKFAAQIYNKNLATYGTIAYLAQNGSIKKLNTADGLKGLRAYFIVPAEANEARIAFIDDADTGIESLESVAQKVENGVYDLQGRRVEATKKGLYIINGKKVVK